MKALILLVFSVLIITSCETCKPRIIIKYKIPDIMCPKVENPEYELLDIKKSEEENMQIQIRNNEKAIKLFKQLKERMKCIEKHLKIKNKENESLRK